jgi:hypothetical protein
MNEAPTRVQWVRAVILFGGSESSSDEVGTLSGVTAPPAETLFRGLCVNCDLRWKCTYPKPPQGVWSCDEYV